ncbi:hypothetical protein SAMN04488096_108107 [Mesonia phycicola]|uniref:Uncharacterized protein n=1 Tax=Mesonia phycicola TaxID=579105 RepID=A0A1M6GM13_9FLAO|nr:hypothetical protein [Mesonia phycicola]SHJ10994.1 hypothetical protein SAMN04488096_108107 [Mesonia phycicola]
MKKGLLLVLLSVVVWSCDKKIPKEKQEYDKAISEILAVHDEVMPQMGTLSSLIEKTEAKIDTTAEGKKFKHVNENLKEAHESMMTWMVEFGDEFPNALKDTLYSIEEYHKREPKVENEKQKVQEMKSMVFRSVEKAKSLLEKQE